LASGWNRSRALHFSKHLTFESLAFEFDPSKAAANLRKHGVSFQEAMTVFDDLLAATFEDELHSEEEGRSITIGLSSKGRLLFVSHCDFEDCIRIIGRGQPMPSKREALKTDDPVAPRPLDWSKAVRGKYYDRMQRGTNIVLIEPDLLDSFPDSAAVNKALRSLKEIATRSAKPTQHVRETATASR
jgi:uncharacterized DUF497 family protein